MNEDAAGQENLGYKKDIYQIARERVVHEDNLVNNRLTWFLVIQSFLFASYGVVLEASSQDCHLIDQASSFVWLFPFVGVSTSLMTLSSVAGSRLARHSIRAYWNEQKVPGLPPLHGECMSQILGDIEAYVLPLVFIFSWGVVYL